MFCNELVKEGGGGSEGPAYLLSSSTFKTSDALSTLWRDKACQTGRKRGQSTEFKGQGRRSYMVPSHHEAQGSRWSPLARHDPRNPAGESEHSLVNCHSIELFWWNCFKLSGLDSKTLTTPPFSPGGPSFPGWPWKRDLGIKSVTKCISALQSSSMRIKIKPTVVARAGGSNSGK